MLRQFDNIDDKREPFIVDDDIYSSIYDSRSKFLTLDDLGTMFSLLSSSYK